MPQDLPKVGSLLRRYLKPEYFQKLLLQLFFIGFVSVPVTVVALTVLLKLGHTTSFTTNDPHSGWTGNPDTRGTFNVIWACLSTIFTCVYISVHVGVAAKSESSSLALRLIAKPELRKVYWLLFNIFAPELMVLVALCELQSAMAGVAFMRRRGANGWKIRHSFFADMGGFRLSNGYEFRRGTDFYQWFDQIRPELDFDEIESDIKDRSKANSLLKVLTCAQASWFLVETVVRFAKHLPVSELEVTTCTYIVCAIITYGCWLRKPYGVDGRITLDNTQNYKTSSSKLTVQLTEGSEASRIPTCPASAPSDYSFRTEASTAFTASTLSFTVAEGTDSETADDMPRPLFPNTTTTPFNRAYEDPARSWLIACHTSSCVGVFIGVFHAVPFWNTQFANTQGQWIWRACCLMLITLPIALVFVTIIEYKYTGLFMWAYPLIIAFLYCIARTGLFALICLSFESLPSGVYHNASWSWNFLPHWS